MAIQAATGPVCWGVDFPDAETNPPWPTVLDEIGLSGCSWLELGPLGYLPEGRELAAELEQRGLGVVGSFLFEPLHDPAARERLLAQTERTSAWIASAKGRYLVVIDAVSEERSITAGRSDAARRLSDGEWAEMVSTISQVCDVAGRHGLRAVLHPHAGSFIEFDDEIDRILVAVDRAQAGLCIDTGHSAYAGVDPVRLIERHADRLEHLHFKDVDPAALKGAIDAGLDFWAASDAGVFCCLGAGVVDFRGVAAALGAAGYVGWGTIEQDRHPTETKTVPLDDVRASVEHLRETGITA